MVKTRIARKLFLTYVGLITICVIIAGIFTTVSFEMVLWGALPVLFVALGVGFMVARMITKPLREMTGLAKDIAGGNFSRKLRVHSYDEIGEAACSFNRMAEELKTKLQALTEDRNEMRAILSSMIEGVVAIDRNEKVMLFNLALEKIFGLSQAQVLGKFFWEVIRNDELNDLLKEAMNKGRLKTRELTLFLPEERIFQVHALPIKGEEEPGGGGVVAVLHEITELKGLERMRIEFVANVSHELRTPLTSIRGFVETLKEGAINDPQARIRFLSIIEKHADRLNSLINDLLQISRIESEEIKMEFQFIDIKELINEVISNFREKIELKGHTVEVHVFPELPGVSADPERIEQVLSNLLDNAIKFTPDKGRICLFALDKGGNIQVEVSDTGIGIPPEHLPRLFERFYRVDKSRSRELGGTGLGLAIVKHIVLAHGGTVGAESDIGKGSKLFFTLPKKVSIQ